MPKGNFSVEVDGVGAFVFRHRTLRDGYRIEGERDRVLGGPVSDEALGASAMAYAALLVLTVEAPEGWDLDALDPVDDADTGRMFLVYRRMVETAATFHPRAVHNGPGAGPRDVGDPGVRLSPQIQSAAD